MAYILFKWETLLPRKIQYSPLTKLPSCTESFVLPWASCSLCTMFELFYLSRDSCFPRGFVYITACVFKTFRRLSSIFFLYCHFFFLFNWSFPPVLCVCNRSDFCGWLLFYLTSPSASCLYSLLLFIANLWSFLFPLFIFSHCLFSPNSKPVRLLITLSYLPDF